VQWTLHGPEQQLLTKEQVCGYLGTSESSLDRLIASSRFPPGINTSGGKRATLRWFALDVASYLHIQSRINSAGGENEPAE